MTRSAPFPFRASLFGAGCIAAAHGVVMVVLFTLNLHATHDTINWLPFFDYYYSTVATGEFPFWNPYSQLGTPFFPGLQVLGLLDPTNLIFVGLYRFFPDLDPMALYHVRLFSRMFVFILGAHLTICELTRRPALAAGLSIALMLAILPTFLRQHGVVENHYLLPLTTFAILRFFTASSPRARSVWIAVTALIAAISLHLHVPTAFLTHSLIVIAACFARSDHRAPALAYFKSWQGVTVTGLSTFAAFLVCLPIAAAWLQIHSGELFGILRMLLTNGGRIPEFFASDLQGTTFFSEYSRRVALTSVNLAGWVLEPYASLLAFDPPHPGAPPAWLWYGTYSEVRLYFGLGILALAGIAVVRGHRTWPVRLFLLLFAIMLLVSCSFSLNQTATDAEASFTQSIILFIMPWFRLTEALQNLAGIAAFDLAVLAAIGWTLCRRKDMILVTLAVGAALAAKVYAAADSSADLPELTADIWETGALITGAVLVAVTALILAKRHRQALGLLLLVDICLVTATLVPKVVASEYIECFYRAESTDLHRDHAFPLYRPIVLPKKYTCKENKTHGISAPELLSRTPIVLSPPQDKLLGLRNQWFDQFFALRNYYDLIANVGLVPLVDLAGASRPTIDLLPRESIRWVEDRYQAVELLRNHSRDMMFPVVLERSEPTHIRDIDTEDIMAMEPVRPLPEHQRRAVTMAAEWRQLPSGTGSVEVTTVSSNTLVASVRAPKGGLLYWAHGYSKDWHAMLNGGEVPISRANLNFMTIWVPPGEHTVSFSYSPRWYAPAIKLYYAGLILFILLVCALGLRYWFRGKPNNRKAGEA